MTTRNVTILGHVDHGKTTLTDSLLASNNIISAKMAGKLRFLDSREDEQERGITMQSSAISLKFQLGKADKRKTYTVNVVDTPGHVDFSSEVSTASRLCDGALVLVDVVEGVCTQTITVLRQAWRDQLKPILIINKLDRLITELKLTPLEAYTHLARLIEQVNAVMGSFFAGQRMEDDWRRREVQQAALETLKQDTSGDFAAGASVEDEEADDEAIYFSPDRGNVIFASAIDGWAFRVDTFAQLYSAKLGMKEATLQRVLWGDFFLDSKTKKVTTRKSARGKQLKPLFVQFVLENIWAVYDSAYLNPNPDRISKIVSAINLKILPRDLKTKDSRHLLLTILSQWLPITSAIVQSVIDIVPSPAVVQATRIPRMLYPDIIDETSVKPKNKLERDMFSANTGPSSSICAYVSKMFAVSERDLPRSKQAQVQAQAATENGQEGTDAAGQSRNGQIILGFARLYSGTLKCGIRLQCVLPKYNSAVEPTHPVNRAHIVEISVDGLYTMMGKDLVEVDTVEAGSIFAISGLEGKVGRSATLCALSGEGVQADAAERSSDDIINLGGVRQIAAPIVRVALEPTKSADMPQLLRGLQLLGQSDPCVQVFQQSSGEHVILTAGELHLERCLRDLNERFAQIEINASKPIVAFRETMVELPDGKVPASIEATASQDCVKIQVQAKPLPFSIADLLSQYSIALIQELARKRVSTGVVGAEGEAVLDSAEAQVALEDVEETSDVVWEKLVQECQAAGGEIAESINYTWAVGRGDKGCGGCLLIDARKERSPKLHRKRMEEQLGGARTEGPAPGQAFDFDSHIESGFHLAVQQGPLCAEPAHAIAYFVVDVNVSAERVKQEQEEGRMPQVASAVITSMKEGCHSALLSWSPRLMLAMYTCDIQVSMDVLGKVYGVVAKRHGQILAEEIKEGTSFFDIKATLPVIESFGFADEIRKRTSGSASPQLIFNGFEMLDENPFWVPTTVEELEDLGDKADRANLAKKYMDDVRERKGLFVDRKVIEFAEKQRTLKK
ncbi:translation elongation factor 2 [Pterulicium gracile]|uniref:Ribosome assembly protein 1 n=1 Tax=Pterulicium gracile TaxID=1884261 RepID=A0A5C3Q4S6_9AGAR|nr:translation elongation factor 2 [Pterula gracilis]